MLNFSKGRSLLAASAAVLGLLLGAGTAPVQADDPVARFTTGSIGLATFFQTLGWQFTTNSPVTVDELGYYDFGGDGLAVPHEVGIFDAAGMLLTLTTVAPATADPLIDGFRYAPITPYTLPAGQTFTIGGVADRTLNNSGYDPWLYNVVPLTSDPSIIIPPNAGRFIITLGDDLTFPNVDGQTNLYAGPNLLIAPSPSSVPEPGSMALLATGVLPLLGIVRRKPWGASAA